jgi:dienelactone hydrolase
MTADLYGAPTYVAGTSTSQTSQSTIIFLTDAFGLKLVNNKLLADAYALATGCRVLVPDIIPGGPMSPDVLPLMDSVITPVPLFNLWGQAMRVWSLLAAMPHVIPFFWRAFPSYPASFKPCLEYARKVKADLPKDAKLGVAGFCWGGNQSINLCSQPAVEGGSERLIDAQFCAHPSKLDLPNAVVEAVRKFKTPVAIAHADNDMALPTKDMEATEAALRQAVGEGDGNDGYYYEVKTYKEVGHGFAVRAMPGSEKEAQGADEAKEQAIEWFKKWLL